MTLSKQISGEPRHMGELEQRGGTLNHAGQVFRFVALEECLTLAQALQSAGRKWHSHVFSPGCIHNPFPEYYCIVLEDESDAYLARADKSFPEVDKDLVKMLHGEDIMDASKVSREGAHSTLLDQLANLQRLGKQWHHHMHFPTCMFNPHRGQWSISVEADSTLMSETFSAEPVDVLRQVEVLYFANLETGLLPDGEPP